MALGDYMGASCHACIGGTNVRAEVQKLQMEAPHIIVGTPGRVFDMLNRRYLCEYCFVNAGACSHVSFAWLLVFRLEWMLCDEPHACHLSLAPCCCSLVVFYSPGLVSGLAGRPWAKDQSLYSESRLSASFLLPS